MRQLGTRGRRKFAAAFAGLSVVLVGVFSPLGMGFASDDAEPAPLNAENAGAIIDADAIASGRVTKASNLTDAGGVGKGLLSGHVYMADPNGNMGANYDNGLRKLDGITVYAQFLDKDGSYSPIFSA